MSDRNEVLASLTDESLGYGDDEELPAENTDSEVESPPEAVETPENGSQAPENASEGEDAEETSEEAVPEAQVDWEKRYKDLQSYNDKRSAEDKARLEAYQQLVEQYSQLNQQPEEEYVHVTSEELKQGIESAPVETFQWATYNRPDLIPHIVSGIREQYGDEMGDQAMFAYQQFQMEQQQAQFQEYVDYQEQPKVVQRSMQEGLTSVKAKYGEEFDKLVGETALVMQDGGGPRDWSPEGVADYVERSFLQAYRDKQVAEAMKPKGPDPVPAPHVETGTPGNAPAPSALDDIGDEIVEAYKRSRTW